MAPEEAHTRWVELHNHVTTQTAQAFVTSFLNRCIRAHTEHHIEDDAGEDVPVLDMGRVVVRYRHSTGRRLIAVDLEGTLWKRDMRIWLDEESKKAQKGVDAEVPEEVVEVLGKLAEDKRNEVWLLSGFRVQGALQKIAEKVPSVGLVCVFFSHGSNASSNLLFLVVERKMGASSRRGKHALKMEIGLTWSRTLI